MSVSFGREQVAAVVGIGREHIPSECATKLCAGTRDGAHRLDSGRSKHPFALPLAAILQRSAEDGNVVGSRKHASVARNATIHYARQGVVYHSLKAFAVGIFLCRRAAFCQFLRRTVVSVFHSEHIKHMLMGIGAQVAACHGLYDALQSDEVEAAIGHVRARFEVAFAVRNVVHQSVAVWRTVLLLQHVSICISWQP